MSEQNTGTDRSGQRPDAPISRRDYLRYAGTVPGAAALAGCPNDGDIGNDDREATDEDGDGDGRAEVPNAPVNLRVEYEQDPNNVHPGETPRFSWEAPATRRGVSQSAYRIHVASREATLEKPDIWDIKIVDTTAGIQVPYDGPALEPETTYHWMVRIENRNWQSEWSEPARFTTTIPGEQWEGTWIGPDYDRSERPSPLLRREFELDGTVTNAHAHISGLGCYELHLNGERVGDNVLDPAMTDYEHTILYSSYDITDALVAGTNVVGVVLGRGRFGEPQENHWGWHDTPWWSDPQLRFQLNVTFADGTSTSIVTDKQWTMTEGPLRHDSLFGGEVYDAREEKPGWATVEYDDSNWDDVEIADDPGGELLPQRIQPIQVVDNVEPVRVIELDPNTYLFDFGVLVSGWVELTVDGPEGTEVTMIQGEKPHEDSTVDIDTNHFSEPIQTDTYVLSGEGTETWEARFSYKGVRYVQVGGYPGTPTLDDLRAKVVHSTIDEGVESAFECSNELLNVIHANSRRAFLNNMHGVPTDTPTFEKNGWTGDALVTAEQGMYNFDMARFWRKWLRDCRDAQADASNNVSKKGNIPVIVPTSGWGYENWTPDPAWQSAFVLIPWWCYQYYGDERFLEENYEGMRQYLQYLQEYTDGGIIRDGLGDWASPGNRGEPPEAPDIVSTCYYYRDTRVMAQVAGILDRDEEEITRYEAFAKEIRTELNAEYLDKDKQYYRSRKRQSDSWLDEYRQTDNAMPLAFGMVPAEYEEVVVENLVENVTETHDSHLNTGCHGTKFLLPVLTEYGYHDVAYTVATQTSYPSWGYWVENDMTALLEFWELDARSRSHHFLGTIDEWFYKYLAGIKLVEPGFAHVRIAPKPVADLNSAAACVDTVRGQIVAEWERAGNSFNLAVTVPGNTTATVKLPTFSSDAVTIREDGNVIWRSGDDLTSDHPGTTSATRDGDLISVEIGAGMFDFEVEQFE